MDTRSRIKEFACHQHPYERILRALRKPNADKLLFCVECLMHFDTNLNSSLTTLDRFISEIHSMIVHAQNQRALCEVPRVRSAQ